jgi:sugar-phosphatase
MKTLNYDAFLFDVDATLVDSSACIEAIWRIWSEKYGFDLARVMEVIHGRTILAALEILAPHMVAEKFVVEVQDIALGELKNVTEITGAKSFLAALPQGSWAVGTSGARQVSLSSMRNAGLPIPDAVVAAEDVTRGKPDPEPYLKAANLLGVKPENCIVFEDSMAGIKSGMAAGASVVALTTTHGADELTGVDFLIRDFSQVTVKINPAGSRFRFALLIDD